MSEQPYINAHWLDPNTQTTIELTMMFVPADQRGQGIGRQFYAQWEASLSPSTQRITLFAADTGNGNSDGFWEKMGFVHVYHFGHCSNIDYESQHRMHKGIHGHATPATQDWISHDTDEIIDAFFDKFAEDTVFRDSIDHANDDSIEAAYCVLLGDLESDLDSTDSEYHYCLSAIIKRIKAPIAP